MSGWLADFIAREGLPPGFADVAQAICLPLADKVAARAAATPGLVVGICGPQASGKSTLTAVTRRLLEDRGLKVALFSLDDLYLTHAQRQALARDVHPLLATRGVPGTHDVALGLSLIEALKRPGEVALPAFDKARDDRRIRADWPRFEGPADVILFEGWCVGARPQDAEALVTPLNDLERTRDPDGAWRGFVNGALAGSYQDLFGRIDMLVLLRAPGFEVVLDWRREQERKLRERLAREGEHTGRAMTDEAVAAFIAHYERLTRWILDEMPERADLVIGLDDSRRPV